MSISSRLEYGRDEDLLDDTRRPERTTDAGVGPRRRLAGAALALLVLPLLTLLLKQLPDTLSLEGQVLIYLAAVVGIALVGGLAVAVASAVGAALLINYYFVEPQHTLTISDPDQAVALAVFVIVAVVVSGAVELASRRARAAERAREEAQTLAALSRPERSDREDRVRDVLLRARETYGMESVALTRREPGTDDWVDVDSVGYAPPGSEAPLRRMRSALAGPRRTAPARGR